jgi:hypothetical protein
MLSISSNHGRLGDKRGRTPSIITFANKLGVIEGEAMQMAKYRRGHAMRAVMREVMVDSIKCQC